MKNLMNNTFRKRYRKQLKAPNNYVLCIYGRLVPIGKVKAYCDLHKCYLEPRDIKERQCNKKKCNNLKELGKYKDVEV